MITVCLFRSLVVKKIDVRRMCSYKLSYEEAVGKLNSLQSNKATIEQIRKNKRTGQKCTNIEDMENYLSRTGVLMTKLDQLSVIHVAGTKGKGSTSAMCESILRHHGFRTGFYSSPHLVAVRERIRIGGRVISEEMFAQYFHRVYNMLDATKAHEGDMPGYFAFLTVMAFNTFLLENVDVAIIEVGIGGIVDYTNVLRNVPVVGITALGLDHTAILGDTLPQIAAAKAGIIKRGCRAYTVRQPCDAMRVLQAVADQVQCSLTVVPDYGTYRFPNGYKTRLQSDVAAYQMNASLAIQLAHAWMRTTEHNSKNGGRNGYKIVCGDCNGFLTSEVPYETGIGLKESRWPGRYQMVEAQYARFYLDGAHTKESMEICAEWFQDNTRNDDKVLIFSATGDRDAEALLRPLKDINFKHIFFVIPTAYKATNVNSDNYSVVEQSDLLARCHRHSDVWEGMSSCQTKIAVMECVADALVSIKKGCNGVDRSSVLITGSLHLVGAALSILDPNLSTHS